MDGAGLAELESAANQVIETSSVERLDAIAAQDGPAAVVWTRRPQDSFQSWIDALDPAVLPTARIILKPDAVFPAVQTVCETAGLSAGPERDQLCGDIAALADLFASLMDTKYLRLRLERVEDNACRKFHLDAVTVRLVCTYRGTGTQYGFSVDGQDPADIFTVPTASPILLRGSLFEGRGKNLLRHRSPPIAGTGEVRLVLVLDPISDPELEI